MFASQKRKEIIFVVLFITLVKLERKNMLFSVEDPTWANLQ